VEFLKTGKTADSFFKPTWLSSKPLAALTDWAFSVGSVSGYVTRTSSSCKLYYIFDNGLNNAHSDWQETDPSAPQRQHRNFQTKNNIWSQVPEWTRHQDILTDWPSVVTWLWLWVDESVKSFSSEMLKDDSWGRGQFGNADKSRYQATANENWKDLMRDAVQWLAECADPWNCCSCL
jgi:hypothetical protein